MRVLGLAPHGAAEPLMRPDTPLAGLGIDSLALLLVADVLADSGWRLDLSSAREAVTISDLVSSCVREDPS